MRGVERLTSSGIKTDCEILLNEFVKTKNVRYEDFVAIWKRMNFSYIYFGLKHQVDQQNFTEDALEVATIFMMPPFTFQVRIGALYLLYGLYFTQLQEPKIKIRITLNHWQEVITFHEEIHKQQHLDAEYVFLKLKVERAFMVTATTKPMFYQRKFTKSTADTTVHMHQPHSILADFIDSESLECLELQHKKYEYLKTTLKRPKNQSLKIVKESMSTFINSKIQGFIEEQSHKSQQPASNEDHFDKSENIAACERASRIAEIKQKSFHGCILSPQHHLSKKDVTSPGLLCSTSQTETAIDSSSVQLGENMPSTSTLSIDETVDSSKTKRKRGRPKKINKEGSSPQKKKAKITGRKKRKCKQDYSID